MGLRFASTEANRLELPDGDWIEVRSEISKGTFKQIMKLMPQKELRGDEDGAEEGKQRLTLTQGEAVEYQTALFGALVVGWSLPVPPTVDAYERLENDSASQIDSVLGDYFGKMGASKDELGKRSTSPGSRRKG